MGCPGWLVGTQALTGFDGSCALPYKRLDPICTSSRSAAHHATKAIALLTTKPHRVSLPRASRMRCRLNTPSTYSIAQAAAGACSHELGATCHERYHIQPACCSRPMALSVIRFVIIASKGLSEPPECLPRPAPRPQQPAMPCPPPADIPTSTRCAIHQAHATRCQRYSCLCTASSSTCGAPNYI